MDYSIFIWEIVTFVMISIVSSLIYLYCDYQDSNNIYKLFIPKNDSIWERVKVLIAPSLLLIIIECLFIDINANFMFAKLVSLIVMALVNPLFFIIYFSFSKWDMIVINIYTTISSTFIGLLVSSSILSLTRLSDIVVYISAFGIMLIILFYIFATFFQYDDLIFIDPVTKKITLKKDR